MTSTAKTPIYNRAEPIFGVCEALGDDLRVNPDLFRISLAPLLFWNPVGTIVGYFAIGLFLLALRLLQPDITAPASEVLGTASASEAPTESADEVRLAA